MDDTWRKVRGTKVVADGVAIQLSVETIDGRIMIVQLVPEAVSALVGALVDAKTRALFVQGGGEDGLIDSAEMRQSIKAEKFVVTDYMKSGHCLVQVMTAGGGIFEFLIPADGGVRQEVQG